MLRRSILPFLVLLMSCFFVGCSLIPGPQARIALSVRSGYPPLTVQFDALPSAQGAQPIAACHWDFGDGTSGEGRVVTHTYEEKGTYTVTLTVVDNAGRKSSVETSIEALNRLPHAEFSYEPYQPPIDHPVRFDAALSSDEDGEIVSYEWDFGDGVRATGPVVEHVFPDERILYAVVLTVTDEDGASNATLEYVQAIGCATCG